MRKYIRHPSNIPIEFQVAQGKNNHTENLHDISVGGLSFQTQGCIKKNSIIKIHIPIMKPAFYANGVVVWCHKHDNAYDVGVKFVDNYTAFRVRMIEQICYIEGYRKQVFEVEGRKLSGEEAAEEWIDKFAKNFPDTVHH